MRKLDNREKRLAVLTFVVVTSGLLYVRVLEPVAKTWLETLAETRNAENRLANLQTLAKDRSVIENDYSRLVDSSDGGESEAGFLASLLMRVESLGRSAGLQVTAIKPLGKSQEKVFDRYAVEVSARGEPNQLILFLHSLQDPANLLVADRLTVMVGRTSPRLTLTLLVSKMRIAEKRSEN